MSRTPTLRVATLVSLLALGAAATRSAAAAGPPPAAPTVERAAPADRPTAPGRCSLPGLDEVLRPGAVLFFGELHGSVEAPAFVAEVACAVRQAGLPLVVGLEIPVEEAPRLEAFFASDGSATDRAALLTGSFWHGAFQDGRRSAAMAELLDRLRALRQEHGSVTLAAFDSERQAPSGQARDEEMAARLVASIAAAPGDAVVVALAGNVHTRTRPGVPWNPDYRPMAYLAAAELGGRQVRGLDLASPPGVVWMCPSADPASCGPQKVGGRGDGRPRVELLAEPAGGHDGRYHVAELTASPPAALPGAADGGR